MNGNLQIRVAQLFGAVLTVVGLIGFVSGGRVLIFDVNGLHNVVHLLSGVLGLAAGTYAAGRYARTYNKTFGITYALVTTLGFIAPSLMGALLHVNTADNFLHLAIAVVLIAVGFSARRAPVQVRA